MNILLSILGKSQSNVKKFTRRDSNGKSYTVPVVIPSNKIHSTSSLSTMDSEDMDQDNLKTSVPKVVAADVDNMMFLSLLETYNCGEILGKGSSAQVFEVTNKLTGVKYACKVVHKNTAINDDSTMAMETEIMKRMKHENIVGLHELYETTTSKWFILEIANGGTLHTALAAETSFTEEFVAQQFKQVLQGVQYLHSMGIVHRDIKQDNILCSFSETDGRRTYTAKITDFGLSATIDSNRVRNVKSFSKLKEMWGTKEYFAPEVYKKAYGPQVDVWALGCVLYELLTGETPFPTRERQESKIERFLLNGGVKSKRYFELRPGWQELSEEARDLIRKMLKVNPRRRLSVEECLSHPWIVTATTTPELSVAIARVAASQSLLPVTHAAGHVSNAGKVLVEAHAAAVKRAQAKEYRQKALAAEVVRSVNQVANSPKRC